MAFSKLKKTTRVLLIVVGIPLILALLHWGYQSYKSEAVLRPIDGKYEGCADILTDIFVKLDGPTFEATASQMLATEYKIQSVMNAPVFRAELSEAKQKAFIEEASKKNYFKWTPKFQSHYQTHIEYTSPAFSKFDDEILADWTLLAGSYGLKEDNGDTVFLMKVSSWESDLAFQAFQIMSNVDFVEYNTRNCAMLD